MVVPEIKAKLTLVPGGGAVDGGDSGGFTKSENRAFRLEQLKSLRLSNLGGSTLSLIAKALGPTGIIAGLLGGLGLVLLARDRDPPKTKSGKDVPQDVEGLLALSEGERAEILDDFREDMDEVGGTMDDFKVNAGDVSNKMFELDTSMIDLPESMKTAGFKIETEGGKMAGVLDQVFNSLEGFATRINGIIIQGGFRNRPGERPFIGDKPVQGPFQEDGTFVSNQGMINNANKKIT